MWNIKKKLRHSCVYGDQILLVKEMVSDTAVSLKSSRHQLLSKMVLNMEKCLDHIWADNYMTPIIVILSCPHLWHLSLVEDNI